MGEGRGERNRGRGREERDEAGSGSREREGEHVRVRMWKGRIWITPLPPTPYFFALHPPKYSLVIVLRSKKCRLGSCFDSWFRAMEGIGTSSLLILGLSAQSIQGPWHY